MSAQPEALRLADSLDECKYVDVYRCKQAAAELRRLHQFAEDQIGRATTAEAELQMTKATHALKIAAVEAQRDALLEALKMMLLRDERNTCRHEETHRGGAIWEICDSCGAMWADDQGGKPEWEDPKEWAQARAAIKAVEE